MALYFYRAFSKDGKKVSGQLDAPTKVAVKEQLTRQGLYPIQITPANQASQQAWWKKLFSKGVSAKDKILFTKQLAILLKSGVSLMQSFELLVDQFTGALKNMIITIKDDIKEGSSFADALQKYSQTFENLYIQLVRAGEASGKLEVVLDRLVEYLEKRAETTRKVKAAMTEPIMQLVVAFLVVVYLVTKVVPQMAKNFKGNLPAPTQLLLTVSDFIVGHFILLTVGIVTIVTGFLYWKSTAGGRQALDQLKLKLPMIKFFTKMSAVVQFSRTFGVLLASGVNLSEALDIVCKVINNQILATTLQEAKDKIIKQGKIAQYLKQTNIFPPIAIYLIRTGEETGKLDEMLLTVANNYEVELDELTDKLVKMLQPAILVVMAFVVGFIVISIALPMFKMGENV